jgi:hypothetical protein
MTMKFLLPALLLAAMPALMPAAAASPVCIDNSRVANTHATDDERAILFTMKNGDVWRNDLKGRCAGLRFEGFIWTLHGSDRICDNQQSLQTIQSHSICLLGRFTPVPKKP